MYVIYVFSAPCLFVFFFFSSRRRHPRCLSDWSSDVCSSDLSATLSFACTRIAKNEDMLPVWILYPYASAYPTGPTNKGLTLVHRALGQKRRSCAPAAERHFPISIFNFQHLAQAID